MNIEQMKYLIDISKTNSISNTAKRLFISQQALSDSIRRLEKEFNCEILTRSRSGVTFTEAGQIILEAAKKMVCAYEETEVQLRKLEQKTPVAGKLTVGISPMAISVLLNELMLQMHKTYPDVQLVVIERTYDAMIAELNEGNIDLAIFGRPAGQANSDLAEQCTQAGIHVELLYEDDLICVMDRNHPLQQEERLKLEELQNVKCSAFLTSAEQQNMPGCIHCSNNVSLHQHLMQEESTVTLMPYQAFLAMFSSKKFVAKVIEDADPVPTFLAYKDVCDTGKNANMDAFVKMVHTAISAIA